MSFNSEEQLGRNKAIFKTLFHALLPQSGALPLRSKVAGLAPLLGGLEGGAGRAVLEWGEVPHDGGVARVDLDILHFLFPNYDYNGAGVD